MLTITHQIIGSLVVITNGIAALWLYLLDRWEFGMDRNVRWVLGLARGALALQVLLGLMLLAGGGAGIASHYLFALLAVAALWYGYAGSRQQRRGSLRMLALGCGGAFLCSLTAYLLGQH